MSAEMQDRITNALHLIEGQAALVEAQFAGGMTGIPSLPLRQAASELTEALRITRVRRLINAALIETLQMEGAA